MKKKFYISLLTLVFFLSTTSLPVSIHLCKMMRASSVEVCKMCAAKKKAEGKVNACCSLQKPGANLKSSISSSCCSTELIDATVKDNFLSNKTTVTTFNYIKLSQAVTFLDDIVQLKKLFYSDNNNSPPPLLTNEIYLVNSSLLI